MESNWVTEADVWVAGCGSKSSTYEVVLEVDLGVVRLLRFAHLPLLLLCCYYTVAAVCFSATCPPLTGANIPAIEAEIAA